MQNLFVQIHTMLLFSTAGNLLCQNFDDSASIQLYKHTISLSYTDGSLSKDVFKYVDTFVNKTSLMKNRKDSTIVLVRKIIQAFTVRTNSAVVLFV